MQSNDQALQNALRLAQSPAGQQLIRMLQKNGGSDLQAAVEKAAAGDYAQAKQVLSTLLESADIQKMLEQLGR